MLTGSISKDSSHLQKIFSVLLVAAILSLSFSALNHSSPYLSKKEKIKRTVFAELATHPKASLIDIYKFFFLGAFGPGHMIKNRQSAVDYLNKELQSATTFDSLPWQPVGYDSAYYRINLRLIKDGRINKDSLIKAFVQSAHEARPPSITEWKKEWKLIIFVLEKLDLKIAAFKKDRHRLMEMLNKNQYVVHHSPTYIELYHPHYRIVSRKYFQKLLKRIN